MHTIHLCVLGLSLAAGVLGDVTATIQLGPLSNLAPPASTTTIAFAGKAMLVVVPTAATSAGGIPPGGIDIFLSPDLVAALRETEKASCSSVNTACQKALQDTIQNQTVDIQARGLESAIYYAIAASALPIAYLISLLKGKVDTPEFVHLEPNIISEFSVAASASAFAIGVDNAPPIITVTKTPQAKTSSTQGPTPTLNVNASGDIIIQMSRPLAIRLENTIIRGLTCPIEHPRSRKRTPDFNCLTSAANNVILNAGPHMGLADLVLIAAPRAPALRNIAAEAARALTAIAQFARDSAPYLRLSPDNAEIFGELVFALVYDAVALGVEMSVEIILEAAKWTTNEPVSSVCSVTATVTNGNVACTMSNVIMVCVSDYDETTASGCGVSMTGSLTTTWAPLPTYTVLPMFTAAPPVCYNYADFHAGVKYCQCNDGKNYVLPSGGVCASYTGIPPSQSLVPTQTHPAPPPPTPTPATKTLILVFWFLPPVTGPVTYRLFEVAADSKRDFDLECGHQVADDQFGYYNDPKQGRVDDWRSKGTEPIRQAPGILPPGPNDKMISHGVPALYKENTIGKAGIDWPNLLKHVDCQPPTSDQQHTFTSKMGSTCDDNPTPHVMNLVMVCPVNF